VCIYVSSNKYLNLHAQYFIHFMSYFSPHKYIDQLLTVSILIKRNNFSSQMLPILAQ